ncbi:MAG: four helix bundle protein [Bacteroidota bacterium]
MANEMGDNVWNLVEGWGWFAKETLGRQIVRSADSISFNICEGYGRYYYKEKKLFYYYARGSLYEMQEGLRKALNKPLTFAALNPILNTPMTNDHFLLLPYCPHHCIFAEAVFESIDGLV